MQVNVYAACLDAEVVCSVDIRCIKAVTYIHTQRLFPIVHRT